MLRHAVMIKLDDEATPSVAKELLESLRSSLAEQGGILSFELGLNLNPDPLAYDLMYQIDFPDQPALEAYLADPGLAPLRQKIGQWASDLAFVDYTLKFPS